jgi:hypothetical protein
MPQPCERIESTQTIRILTERSGQLRFDWPPTDQSLDLPHRAEAEPQEPERWDGLS